MSNEEAPQEEQRDENARPQTVIPVPDGVIRRAVMVFDFYDDGGLQFAIMRRGVGQLELFGLLEVARTALHTEGEQDGGLDEGQDQPYQAN